MMFYAIGKPGDVVTRYSTNPTVQALQDGEVMVETEEVPDDGHHRIADDGKSLVLVDVDAATKLAQAWNGVRFTRDLLRNAAAWTIAADSPLSDASRSAWLAYLKALNAIYPREDIDPAKLVWPEVPSTEYAA